jgi:hypothetical protein
MHESELFSSIALAEKYFALNYGHRLRTRFEGRNDQEWVFRRWLMIHFGIEVEVDYDRLWPEVEIDKPWREGNQHCRWMLVDTRTDELAILFKLRF